MGYWLRLLLLHCIHSSLALPTEIETKHQDEEERSMIIDDPAVGVVAHEIATRNQDPTENLVCRFFKMNVPQRVVMVPASPVMPIGSTLVAPASVGLREYLYSPATYAALCVSPEKPKPYPLFFSPPAPLAAPPAPPTVPASPASKAPAVAPTAMVSRPTNAMSAPSPAISLVFSSPVGSIGIGSVSTPAVNIGTQSIIDSAEHPTWLVRRVMLPFR